MCDFGIGAGMSVWGTSSQCLTFRNNQPQLQPISGTAPVITRDHVLLSAPPGAPNDEAVPSLATDAADWRALAADVPGMRPEMVIVADLLGKLDTRMAISISKSMDAVGLGGVSHVSDLFYRLRSKHIAMAERMELHTVAKAYFEQYNVSVEEVGQQWVEEVMDWVRQRSAFAHPLGRPIDTAKLVALKAAVGTQPEFVRVKTAVNVMIQEAEAAAAEVAAAVAAAGGATQHLLY